MRQDNSDHIRTITRIIQTNNIKIKTSKIKNKDNPESTKSMNLKNLKKKNKSSKDNKKPNKQNLKSS